MMTTSTAMMMIIGNLSIPKHSKNSFFSRKWKREQRKSEIMRSFPPSYVSGGNPHLAATYMANLNKAAAYAAHAAASRHSMIGPSFGGPPQSNLGATSVTSQEDLTVDNRVRLQQDAYGHNIYAVSGFFDFESHKIMHLSLH